MDQLTVTIKVVELGDESINDVMARALEEIAKEIDDGSCLGGGEMENGTVKLNYNYMIMPE